MTDEHAVVRLRLSADSPSALAEALGLARDDVPRAEQLHELEAALMPLLSDGAKSGTTSKLPKRPVAAGAALGAKLLMAAAVAAAGVGGALHHFAAQSRAVPMAVPASAPAVPAAASSLRPAEPARVAPMDETEAPQVPTSAEPTTVEHKAVARTYAASGVAAAPSAETAVTAAPSAGTGEAVFPDATGSAEVTLLERAQRALRADPASALALTDEHARQFPAGALTQEREFVAIEALAALGRWREATTRADTFRARFPDSAHLRRIDLLLRPTSDDAP